MHYSAIKLTGEESYAVSTALATRLRYKCTLFTGRSTHMIFLSDYYIMCVPCFGKLYISDIFDFCVRSPVFKLYILDIFDFCVRVTSFEQHESHLFVVVQYIPRDKTYSLRKPLDGLCRARWQSKQGSIMALCYEESRKVYF